MMDTFSEKLNEFFSELTEPQRAEHLKGIQEYIKHIKFRDLETHRNLEADGRAALAAGKVVSLHQWKSEKENQIDNAYKLLINE